MVQGSVKMAASAKPKKVNSAKNTKRIANAGKTKKGSSLKLPNNRFRYEAMEERRLTKAIDKANEQKVAAKLIQGGERIGTTDIMKKGKELNKELRRSQVKKKLTRVEEKLEALKDKAEREGLV
jgi:hypothetical protein